MFVISKLGSLYILCINDIIIHNNHETLKILKESNYKIDNQYFVKFYSICGIQ